MLCFAPLPRSDMPLADTHSLLLLSALVSIFDSPVDARGPEGYLHE